MSNLITSAIKTLSVSQKVPERNSNARENEKGSKIKSIDSSSFTVWKDAMKMVARLPEGIPTDFRKQLWLSLAKKSLDSKNIDLKKAFSVCLSERSDPEDAELGTQIIKDLHRTGCSPFSGDVAEQNQSHLKKVLLAYARWNPNVGYCQGFNMLAAIILEVVEWEDEDALLVMIFLIEEVLPDSYFANHLRGLSVDMAVFRDLLRLRLSSLSTHLDKLQSKTQDASTGYIYEPPLTNVFTMQWFLTLFTNCLPKETVLRVWDLIFLEGNEVLLRTALAIWDGLADRIMAVENADEFYCIMGVLTREILEFGLMDANMFIKTICTLAPFPFPQLQELRDSYTYNIQPFTNSLYSDSELQIFAEDEDDDSNAAKWYFSNQLHWYKKKGITNSAVPFTNIGPGAYSSSENSFPLSFTNFNTERMTLDISSLKKQYMKLRERQRQAHVILSGAFQNHFQVQRRNSLAVNHLLMGKQPLTRKKSHQTLFVFADKPPNSRPPSVEGHHPKHRQNENDSTEEDEVFHPPTMFPCQSPTNSPVTKNCDSKIAANSPPTKFTYNGMETNSPVAKFHDGKMVSGSPVAKFHDSKMATGSPVAKFHDSKMDTGSPVARSHGRQMMANDPGGNFHDSKMTCAKFHDRQMIANKCRDRKLASAPEFHDGKMADKPRRSSMTFPSGVEAGGICCNCSSSFVCPSHAGTLPEKPTVINPFPTRRRIGSMKTKFGK